MRSILRNQGFNCLFMYVSSPKYRIFGQWLSEVNIIELTIFYTHLVFICKTFNSKANISTKSQNPDLILADYKYVCDPAKFHL